MQWLELTNFRSWRRLRVDLTPARLYITGPNGIGKTSILEAIHIMSRLHSFRTRQWREIAQHGKQYWRVDSDVGAVEWREEGKSFFLPNAIPSTPGELYGRAAAVYMGTGDAHWLLSGSAARRSWLDGLIALQEPSYMDLLRRWRRVLAQRNAWLRSESFLMSVGDALEPLYISLGWEVTKARMKLFEALDPLLISFAKALSRDTAQVYHFDYRPNFKELPESLSRGLEQERALGVFLAGTASR
jgi:DNA replication and repair protein RecF